MKCKYLFLVICAPLFMATECHRNYFFPDPDDNGLSRFTSRGYNLATNYINDVPFKNIGGYTLLQKNSSGGSFDTLKFSWEVYPSDAFGNNFIYQNISFLFSVDSSFGKKDLLAFNGKRFLNPTTVVIKETQDSTLKSISGTGNFYFVSVTEDLSYPPQKYVKLSGLFDGNIGDTVLITKGRFDFEINESDLNF